MLTDKKIKYRPVSQIQSISPPPTNQTLTYIHQTILDQFYVYFFRITRPLCSPWNSLLISLNLQYLTIHLYGLPMHGLIIFKRRKPFESFYEIFSWVLRPDGNFGPLKRTRNSTYPGVTKTYKPPPLLLGIFTFRLYLNFRFSSSNFEPNKMKMHSRSVIIIYCTFSAFSLLNKIVFSMGLIFTIRWRRVMGSLTRMKFQKIRFRVWKRSK